MGIKQLTKLIGDHAPAAIKEITMESYFGRKIAVDASMSIYQFLIAMQNRDGSMMLTNDAGEVTSHLNGLMMRTAKMLECGIKPAYVFDGKAPDLKKGTLADRKDKRIESEAALAEAKEVGDDEAVEKFAKRTVHVTKEMTEDAKTLLRLLGVPVIDAPSEAEAQCAALAQAGVVNAAVSEDMDTLTFGAPVMLRNLFQPESRKLPVLEITLSKVLEGLELTMPQFIDLCILMGCDYCGTLKQVGPKRAHELVQKHKSISQILKHIDLEKYTPPDPFNHEEIHAFFEKPDVQETEEVEKLLVWKDVDEDGLRKFMVHDKQFDEKRINTLIERIKKARGTSTQQRLDGFFTKLPPRPDAPAAKRPAGKDIGGAAKKGKPGAGGGRGAGRPRK